MYRSLNALILTVTFCLASTAHAETLLIERVKERPSETLPMRGQSMAFVESRLGAPQQKLEPRGGQKRQWPTINRWVYPNFTVYFEKQQVIDVVANQANRYEIGPKRR